MTIDLNFVWLTTGDGKKVGIVDVPGHQRFVKNMISGTMNIDAFLFILAADDGWMPQSEEHLQVLKTSGISRGLGIITKTDLVTSDRLSEVREQMAEHFSQTFASHIELIPFSTTQPEQGLLIRERIESLVRTLPPPRDIGRPRLWVDRVFSPKGMGVVVTGTLREGSLREGDSVNILPQGHTAVVKSLQSYHQPTKVATPVSRVAIQLSKISHTEIARGSLIYQGSAAHAVKTIDAKVTWFGKPFVKNTQLTFHLGTAHVAALVIPLPGNNFVRIKLTTALPIRSEDRFILRTFGEERSVGAGVVVDAKVEKTPHRKAVALLQHWREGLEGFLDFEIAKRGVAGVSDLGSYGAFSEGEINRALAASPQFVEIAKEVYTQRAQWENWKLAAQGALRQRAPETGGISEKDFFKLLNLPSTKAKQVLGALVKFEIVSVVDGTVRLPPALRARDPREAQFKTQVLAKLNAQTPLPVSLKELLVDQTSKKYLSQLVKEREAIGLGEDHYLLPQAYDLWKTKVYEFLKSKGSATTSDLRIFLNISRKPAVQILEHLDRDRVTYLKDGVRRLLKG